MKIFDLPPMVTTREEVPIRILLRKSAFPGPDVQVMQYNQKIINENGTCVNREWVDVPIIHEMDL